MSGLPTRLALAAGIGLVGLIILGTALWFLGDALLLLLEEKGFRPSAAAGLAGLAGLMLVLVAGLAARWALRPPRQPATPAATTRANGLGAGIAADLGALAAQQIVSTTRAHPYSTAGAALAAGVAVGALPELRKAIFGLLKH